MTNTSPPRASEIMTLSCIGEEVWMEFVQPGIRLRIEMSQEEIDSLAEVAAQVATQLRGILAKG